MGIPMTLATTCVDPTPGFRVLARRRDQRVWSGHGLAAVQHQPLQCPSAPRFRIR